MNPRQRRGLFLIGLAAVGAIVVFFAVSSYVDDVRSEVGDKVSVMRLTNDVEAFAAITDADFEEVEIPERWAPATGFGDPSEFTGLVPATELTAGSILQEGMLVEEPELGPGRREIAILVDAETGVAGKLGPGNTVDVYATFPAGTQSGRDRSEVIVAGARIIEIGDLRQAEKEDETGSVTSRPVVPVTFSLSVKESLILTYAETFADEVRLALVRPGDKSKRSNRGKSYSGGVS